MTTAVREVYRRYTTTGGPALTLNMAADATPEGALADLHDLIVPATAQLTLLDVPLSLGDTTQVDRIIGSGRAGPFDELDILWTHGAVLFHVDVVSAVEDLPLLEAFAQAVDDGYLSSATTEQQVASGQ